MFFECKYLGWGWGGGGGLKVFFPLFSEKMVGPRRPKIQNVINTCTTSSQLSQEVRTDSV